MDSDYKQQPLKNCLVCRLEICLKAPGSNVDVIIAANLGTFTKVWLGCAGLVAGLESGQISLHGACAGNRNSASLARAPGPTKAQELQIFGLPRFRWRCRAIALFTLVQCGHALHHHHQGKMMGSTLCSRRNPPGCRVGSVAPNQWRPWRVRFASSRSLIGAPQRAGEAIAESQDSI